MEEKEKKCVSSLHTRVDSFSQHENQQYYIKSVLQVNLQLQAPACLVELQN